MRTLLLFVRFYAWFSLRHMWRHRTRALIVVLGIGLGAAVFSSVRLSVHAAVDSFSRGMDVITGKADAVLVRPGGRVPESVVATLLKHPAVKSAAPLLTIYVQSTDPDAEPFLLVGLDPILDRGIRRWQIHGEATRGPEAWLTLLTEPGTLLATEALARRHGWRTGDTISLVHSAGEARFRILATLRSEGVALAEGGRVAITDIASFQEFTGTLGAVDRIDLIGTSSWDSRPASLASLRRQLVEVLPEGLRLESPGTGKESGRAMIRAYQLNLSVLSFASLFVGMFLVYSLVALNTATRRHELAVLRSLGASPILVFALFLTEGAFLGFWGWICALPLGGLMTRYLLHGVSQTISRLFVRVQVESMPLDPGEILFSLAVTILVAILAALQPAREAMKVPPGEALRKSTREMSDRRAEGRLARWGGLLVLATGPLSWIPGYAGVPWGGYLAMLFLFSGFALLCPWGLRRASSIGTPLMRKLAGIPACLAGRYVRDSGPRTAISIGALITAVALLTALIIMIHSFRGTVQLWVSQTVSGDLFITGKMASINRFRDPMPPALVSGLDRLDAPVDMVKSRRFSLAHGTFVYELDLLDLETFFKHGRFLWIGRAPSAPARRLSAGEGVLVSQVFANRTGLETGDIFRAEVNTRKIELPILGVIRDYRTHGGVVFYDHGSFKDKYFDPGWSGARLFFQTEPADMEAALSRLRREILVKCGHHIDMMAGRALREAVLEIFDETFAITTVLLLIAIVIAALGIATTLTVQVLERSRQLNTLFAVGASHGQIRAVIFWEAVWLVLVGEIAGLACGFLLSYFLIYVINVQSFGWSFIYTVDWPALAASFPLIMATALVAAVPAVRLVFKSRPGMLLRE